MVVYPNIIFVQRAVMVIVEQTSNDLQYRDHTRSQESPDMWDVSATVPEN